MRITSTFPAAALLLLLVLSAYPQKKNVEILIVGGTVVTMDGEMRVIKDGAVAIDKGKIVAVGSSANVSKAFSGKTKINAEGKAVIPGLINTHTHIPMTVFRGIADDLDLQEWLTKYIFPAEAKNVDEKMVRIGTRLGLAELIRGGTTTFCDMYYFEDVIAEETEKAGVRGVLGETLIDFPAPDNKTWEEAMAYSEKYAKKWKGNVLITPAIAPHAPYTVSEEHLKATRKLANEIGVPLVIHLAEAQTEVDYVRENKNMRPVEYVNKIGLFEGQTIAAHVIKVNDEEIDVLKRAGVGVAHNPQSNMKLAAGVAPVPSMLAKSLNLGLGTDGPASNNDLSLWEEMDTAAKLHKITSGDPKVVSAEQAFTMATIGGARALHLSDKVGSLEEGKLADIVIIGLDSLHQTPLYNIFSHLVYATKASDVETVIIHGRLIMQDRRLLTLNETAIRRDANALRDKIIDSLAN
ncbi:MAG: amidohydrolase [Acidobacteria bacterium]|nr:MAG: amidohydrolase [Acidobacteriota bacterium]REK04022.1 MAG: amidohydrolase [Acidobacteriota bacterium]REK15184.1 MAG: amidohydrolase [Acidobacteriota bacterium]REK46274.1 MAG: amidohydrolase [Acidobacteriota bacterium]